MQNRTDIQARAAWRASDLAAEQDWVIHLDASHRADLLQGLRAATVKGKPLLAYRKADFPWDRALGPIEAALRETLDGRGLALLKRLPREGLTPEEFELLTWGIGLHLGVARPQDKATRYINPVRDAGTVYRSATGRGYSSNAELDFHADGADVVLLSCYNQAPEGGDSLCCSAISAYRELESERPELAQALLQPFPLSRQGEQGEGESAFFPLPVFGWQGDRLFCIWNGNRLKFGLDLPGAPSVTPLQREAVAYFADLVSRPTLAYTMRLEAGDLQFMNNHTALHSRTSFVDDPDPARMRTLFRLWLSTPQAPELPPSWAAYYGATSRGHLRGGIRGLQYGEVERAFDEAQAEEAGMVAQ